jgi:hypothetical protein
MGSAASSGLQTAIDCPAMQTPASFNLEAAERKSRRIDEPEG